ncbi:MAG: hypoxanthine phosphoribosyltransferase [Deltaproteobacteria bacterium]|nr:hypoxanthine phosphoribosyltransferase [Deltaproteobacteria bacterium]
MEPWKIVYSAEEIRAAVAAVAREIDRDYAGREVLFLAVLKGAFIFLADLVREVRVPCAVDFVRISSYGAGTCTTGVPKERLRRTEPVAGRHVIVVEEVVDSGLTLRSLLEGLAAERPASLKVCALVNKTERRQAEVPIDYRGFTLPGGFIVGYGMDYGERFRNLPDIRLLDLEPAVSS